MSYDPLSTSPPQLSSRPVWHFSLLCPLAAPSSVPDFPNVRLCSLGLLASFVVVTLSGLKRSLELGEAEPVEGLNLGELARGFGDGRGFAVLSITLPGPKPEFMQFR